jgi:membrane protein
MVASRMLTLLRDAAAGWSRDRASSKGAALAFYALLSLAPLLIIAVAVAGFVFGRETATSEIVDQIAVWIGHDTAAVVQSMIERSRDPSAGVIAGVAGLIGLLLGSTTAFAELQETLDQIWGVSSPQAGGLRTMLRKRVLAFVLVGCVGLLLLGSLVMSTVIAAIGKFWGEWFGYQTYLLEVLNFALSVGIITTLFALIYKVLPSTTIAWRDVWVGALFTSLLFTLGKSLIGLYLGRSAVGSAFGAAGSLVLLLLWIYYSAQIFLFGAEFTKCYAHRCGSRSAASSDGEAAGFHHAQ